MQYIGKQIIEEGGGSPTTTGLFSSGLLFIQQNIVGSCSPNMPQVYQGKLPKLLIYTQLSTSVVFFRCTEMAYRHTFIAG